MLKSVAEVNNLLSIFKKEPVFSVCFLVTSPWGHRNVSEGVGQSPVSSDWRSCCHSSWIFLSDQPWSYALWRNICSERETVGGRCCCDSLTVTGMGITDENCLVTLCSGHMYLSLSIVFVKACTAFADCLFLRVSNDKGGSRGGAGGARPPYFQKRKEKKRKKERKGGEEERERKKRESSHKTVHAVLFANYRVGPSLFQISVLYSLSRHFFSVCPLHNFLQW